MLKSPEHYKELYLSDPIIEETLDAIFTYQAKCGRKKFYVFFQSKLYLYELKDVLQQEKIEYLQKNIEKTIDILKSKNFQVDSSIGGAKAIDDYGRQRLFRRYTVEVSL